MVCRLRRLKPAYFTIVRIDHIVNVNEMVLCVMCLFIIEMRTCVRSVKNSLKNGKNRVK